MNVPPLDLLQQHEPLIPQMLEVFEQLIRTNSFVLGPTVEKFEAQLADYCAVDHAIGVSSGTDALIMALMALEIGPGDEVITSPFTFFATAGCIARVGAKPVFVDIEPDTLNLDPALAKAAITPNTKAIMPVHLYGLMADMAALAELAQAHNLHMIEDAAQAIGAQSPNAIVGQRSDVACLSFYPTKNLSALGDAGACITNDDALAEKLKVFRLHGETSKYHHRFVGGNFRIDAVQAAMLSIKLEHLEGWTTSRLEVAANYNEKLSPLQQAGALQRPVAPSGWRHVYHQYTLRVKDARRDALADHLRASNVGCGVYYPLPLHLQECFAYLGGKAGDFPQSEAAADEVISLPIFPGMSTNQIDRVVAVIEEFFA